MRSTFTAITSFIFIFLSVSLVAQTNRGNNKKSVTYKANYQRVSTSCSANYTLEIRNGTIWAWGENAYGQLGDGTTTQKNSPVQINTDTKWFNIAAGQNHSLGIKSDGTLWAWGDNATGQLGDGTYADKISPIQIGTDTKWVSIVAVKNSSFGIKSDGTLWAWGYNAFGQLGVGQLGDGTSVDKTSFTCSGSASFVFDYYRTLQSGNWNVPATWESSLDNFVTPSIIVSPATRTPDFNANTITIRNTHTVTVTANVTARRTTIITGGKIVVNTGIILGVK